MSSVGFGRRPPAVDTTRTRAQQPPQDRPLALFPHPIASPPPSTRASLRIKEAKTTWAFRIGSPPTPVVVKQQWKRRERQPQQQQQRSNPNQDQISTQTQNQNASSSIASLECKICSSDGQELSAYVECFFKNVPEELLNAVSTVVHEFRVDPQDFGELSVRPQYQAVVEDLLKDIRDLPVYPHVMTAAKSDPERLSAILKAAHGLELLTVLLLASPVEDLSACGTRVDAVMRASEEGASEIVRNEIAALRNQLWTVFQPRAVRVEQ
uniref:Uncharacterized protein n=1 Tax=Lotharella oceanica TaxID=641309 RepID=A0A7S2XFN2_9EUKA